MTDNIIKSYLIRLGYQTEGKEELEAFVDRANKAVGIVKTTASVAAGAAAGLFGFVAGTASSLEKLYYQAQSAGADPFRFRAMAQAAQQAGVAADTMGSMLAGVGYKLRTDPAATTFLHGLGIQAKDATDAMEGMLGLVDRMRKQHPGQDETILRNYTNLFAQQLGIDPVVLDTLLRNEGQFQQAFQERQKAGGETGLTTGSLKEAVDTMNKFRDVTDDTRLILARIGVEALPQVNQALTTLNNWFLQHPDEIKKDLDEIAHAFVVVGGAIEKAVGWLERWQHDKEMDAASRAGGPAGGVGELPAGTVLPGGQVGQTPALGPSTPAHGVSRGLLTAQLQKDLGISREDAAAIVGNLEQESGGLNPGARNPTSGAFGLAQWLGPRRKAFLRQQGIPLSSSGAREQTAFLEYELTHEYAGVLAAMKRESTLQGKVTAFRKLYEAPGEAESNDPARLRFAQAALGQGAAPVIVNQNNTTTIHTGAQAQDVANVQNKVHRDQSADIVRMFRGVTPQ